MKIDITNQVKDEFLISLKTLISYPSAQIIHTSLN